MAEIYISKKIKITIHDPIFSGIYVFDRDVGEGDSDLYSQNWILNGNESDHNLIVYQHASSPQNNKLLVSLNDTHNSSFQDYKGYVEIKSSLYKDENNAGAIQIEDAYAFPAHMIFTAIQPAGPFYSEGIGDPWPKPTVNIGGRPSGHRLVVGFCLPLTWDGSYKKWRVVNGVKYPINSGNVLINYAGTPFNDGSTYFSSTDQDVVSLNNKVYISGTTDPTDINSSGYLSIYNIMSNMLCTGVPIFGFGFRCSASGLGFDQGFAWNQDVFTHIQGIGPANIFDTYYTWDGDDPDSNSDFVDTRPFFDNKIPISGTVEFIYGCGAGIVDCNVLETMDNPEIIQPFTKKIGTCSRNSLIANDYLCGSYAMEKPDNAHWTTYNITGTQVIFSGVGDLYPAVRSGNANYTTYKSSSIDPIILVPYSGDPRPSFVRNWISGSYITLQDYQTQSSITYATNTYRVIDLYWKIDYGNQLAKAYIIPKINGSYAATEIFVTGQSPSISDIGGRYVWSDNNSAFLNAIDHKFFIKQGYLASGIFQQTQDEIDNIVADYRYLPEQYTILYSGLSFSGPGGVIQTGEWKPFYRPVDSTAPLPAPSAMLTLPTKSYDICDQKIIGSP